MTDRTDGEVEAMVRDTFRDHEHLVAGGQVGLLQRVRARVRRRRAVAVAGSGLATLAVLAGVVLLTTSRGPAGVVGPPSLSDSTAGRTSTPAPPGWRLESSLGVELIVPEAWATNDIGCGMTEASSVVRGRGVEEDWYTPEPPTKELAIIEEPVGEPFLAVAGHPTSVFGVPASRADGQLPDGRYAGWVLLDSLQVRVEVRTRDAALTRTVLDSVQVMDVDHVGCVSRRHVLTRQSSTGSDFVDR